MLNLLLLKKKNLIFTRLKKIAVFGILETFNEPLIISLKKEERER